jgi:hypothetical protein
MLTAKRTFCSLGGAKLQRDFAFHSRVRTRRPFWPPHSLVPRLRGFSKQIDESYTFSAILPETAVDAIL